MTDKLIRPAPGSLTNVLPKKLLEQTMAVANYEFNYTRRTLFGCSFTENDAIETACINKKNQVQINGEFFMELPVNQRVGTLIHEVYHPILRHFDRALPFLDYVPPLIINMAQDLEVHSCNKLWGYLQDGPTPLGIRAEQFDLPDGRSFEFYVQKLVEKFQPPPKEKFKCPQCGTGLSDQKIKINSLGLGTMTCKKCGLETPIIVGDGSGPDWGDDDEKPEIESDYRGDKEDDSTRKKDDDDSGSGSDDDDDDSTRPDDGGDDDKRGKGDNPDDAGKPDIKKPLSRSTNIPELPDDYTGMEEYDVEKLVRRTITEIAANESNSDIGKGMYDYITEQLKPKRVPWQTLLQNYLSAAVDGFRRGNEEKTYARMGRRGVPGFCSPGTFSPEPNVTVIVDTSGSMGRLLEECKTEIGSLLQEQENIFFIAYDTRATVAQKVRTIDELNFLGGGGTRMDTALVTACDKDFCRKNDIHEPDIVILLTDCETRWPERRLNPTIIVVGFGNSWMCNRESVPSWMNFVKVEK